MNRLVTALPILGIGWHRQRMRTSSPVEQDPSPCRSDAGFTLIEMVISISVVLLMAGTALLAAPGILASATQASCQAQADSLNNAIVASYASHGNYTQATEEGLVDDEYLTAFPSDTFNATLDDNELTIDVTGGCIGQVSSWETDTYTYSDGSPAPEAVSYEVGDTGPAGGTIFYKANTIQPWGQYLEFAPANVGEFAWATNDCLDRSISTQPFLGFGPENTANITTACSEAEAPAAWAAANYEANGFDDWFLPSSTETLHICRLASGQGFDLNAASCTGISASSYGFSPAESEGVWTSHATTHTQALGETFSNGAFVSGGRATEGAVRPVRAF